MKRSIIRGSEFAQVKVTFCNSNPLTAVEVLQALDTALAAEGLVMICQGTGIARRWSCPPPPRQKPGLSSTGSLRSCPFRFLRDLHDPHETCAGDAAKALSSFAKIPNAILAVNGGLVQPPLLKVLPNGVLPNKNTVNLLVLRDYSINVKRMLNIHDL